MKIKFLVTCSACAVIANVWAQSSPSTPPEATPNYRSPSHCAGGKATPWQPEASHERMPSDDIIMRNIQNKLIHDPNMSSLAKNVKVTVVQGVVTLHGPVQSDIEKNTLENYARECGASKVKNQIQVKQLP